MPSPTEKESGPASLPNTEQAARLTLQMHGLETALAFVEGLKQLLRQDQARGIMVDPARIKALHARFAVLSEELKAESTAQASPPSKPSK